MNIRTGDLKLIQELNRFIILKMIREEGPVSRSEIAKKNKISPTTVASAVQELIKDGLVSEIGVGRSSGGRKPILLQFSPDNHFMICVSITNSFIEAARMNLDFRIMKKHTVAMPERAGDQMLDAVLKVIDGMAGDAEEKHNCVGISVVTPGIVNNQSGVIHYNAKLNLADINLKHIIEERYGLKAWIENDTNAMVLAERKNGGYDNVRNLLYITVGEGVGAGIMLNDTLLRGARGGAGEFGHTSMDRSGIRCECGNVGCLENYVGWPAVYWRIVTSISRGRTTSMLHLAGGDRTAITPRIFNLALEEGDPLAGDIADEITGYLGAGIVNLVNLFNPEVIVIGGELIGEPGVLHRRISDYISKHALYVLSDGLQVRVSSLGRDAKLIGAASVLMQDLFHFTLSAKS